MKIFFFLFSFSFLIQSCFSSDTIMRAQSLRDGDVVFSQGNIFAFGFFSLGNSKLRYVGIWYAQISEQTIVWVANRDHPVNDTSGLIKFSSRGDLCVYSSLNETEPLWSTNVSVSMSEPTLVARLSDLGNLVLSDSVTGRRFWESFDHPTNTLLPLMKFGFTRQDGLDRVITSWKSPVDPGFGNFTLRIDRSGFPQMMIYKGTTVWWRTGSWTGQRWSGVPEMTTNFTFVSNSDEVLYNYGIVDPLATTGLVLNEAGTMKMFTWNEGDKKWILFWSAPVEKCDNYLYCGVNGFCDTSSPRKFECTCLPGYEPKKPREWSLRDATGGCVRKNTTSICNGKEGFVRLKRVKVPNTAAVIVDMNITLEECQRRCLRNCSCVAYASAYYEGHDAPKGCLRWHDDLLDTRIYFNAGQDFYLRVDKAELAQWNGNSSSSKRRLVLILATSTVVAMLLIIFFLCFLRKRRQSKRHTKLPSNFSPNSFDLDGSFILEDREDKSRNRELPLFALSMIAVATNDFSFQNKLGEGGFGPVYKGVLPNGMEIAVKRLSRNSGQGMEEFKNEVRLISKLQHRNLVRMLGCCVEFEEKMLIYEYLPNKSLDYFIFHEEHRAELDWPKRMEIIRGIARGILYLHQDSRLRIIHRDLKAGNILLDNEMIPKIADFGMARIFGANQIEGSTNRVVGTYGYMSPEYAMDGHFSIKSDVYSFGILILEIITGSKNSTIYEEKSNLVGHIWKLWDKVEVTEIVDKLMDKETCDKSEVMKCIHIGLLCVQENASERPDMPSVVIMLGNNAINLPTPNRPAFMVGRRSLVINSTSSVTDVTLTDVQGR